MRCLHGVIRMFYNKETMGMASHVIPCAICSYPRKDHKPGLACTGFVYPWKQHTPAAQLIVLHQRMWGDFLNLQEGIVTVDDYLKWTEESHEEMHELLKYAGLPVWPTGMGFYK